MARTVELLPIPTGPALLEVLPRLADALAGIGPALAPVAAGDREHIQMLTAAFGIGEPLAEYEDDEDDPTAVVVATSGSTGNPKGALLPRSALAASAAATQRRLGPAGAWLLALPAEHIAGLQVLLRSLASGRTPHILDSSAPFRAERFTTAVDLLPSGPRYVSLVPTQLHRILADEAATAALSTFTGVLVGGASTSADLLGRARAGGIQLVTSYGMSETCGGCVYDGLPLAGVTAALDSTGRVLFSGAVLARGYRKLPGHPSFTAEAGGHGRTFRTDDLGDWVNGRLHVVGRADDVLISAGLKIAPARLEGAIEALSTVAGVVAVGIPDAEWGQRVVAVIVPTPEHRPPSLNDVRAACADAGIAPTLQPSGIVLIPELPLRGPGKPDRAAALALAAEQVARTTPPPG